MSKTIPQELVSFKTSVGSSIDGMKEKSTSLQGKVKEMISANDSAKNGISNYYNSQNKDAILSKFTYMNDVYNKISTSLSSDLDKMLSESSEIIKLVEELEKLNNEIKEQESIINKESGNDDASKQKISSARSTISSKEKEFDTKSNEATTKLNTLKSMDSSLSFVSEFTITDYTQKLSQLSYGSFEKKTYTASNGVTVEYYIYKPNYGEEVEGLPIHIYLHGSGECGNDVLDIGLPKMLSDKTITPSGIVICPQAKDGNDFYDSKWQAALLELTNNVAEENKADKNKISLSGHSMGAIAAYRLVQSNPDTFSAVVPISGRVDPNNGSLKDVKVWAFHGSEDSTVSYKNHASVLEQLRSQGYSTYLHTFEGEGHGGVQNETFTGQYQDPETGELINPLEWAFRQTRAKA